MLLLLTGAFVNRDFPEAPEFTGGKFRALISEQALPQTPALETCLTHTW